MSSCRLERAGWMVCSKGVFESSLDLRSILNRTIGCALLSGSITKTASLSSSQGSHTSCRDISSAPDSPEFDRAYAELFQEASGEVANVPISSVHCNRFDGYICCL